MIISGDINCNIIIKELQGIIQVYSLLHST
jgi:hypothetical protein